MKNTSTIQIESKHPTAILIMWDWKAQPDWKEINEALTGTPDSCIVEVDTGGDSFAVVVTEKCNASRPQALFRQALRERARS